MALALSANGSAGFNHLMATLASTTRLRTVFEFLPSFEDQITKRDMTPHKPLPKGFHLRDEGTTLCEFFLGYLFLFGHFSLCSTITVTGVHRGGVPLSPKSQHFLALFPYTALFVSL